MRTLKLLFPLLLAMTLVMGIFLFNTRAPQSAATPHPYESGQTFPKEAVQFQYEQLKNPTTGEVPAGGLWKGYKQLKAQGKILPKNKARKTTAGPYWNNIDDFFSSMAITKIEVDPNDPSIMYFCTGEGWYNLDAIRGAGVWKSTDAGLTWNQLPATDITAFYYCTDMVVHPITSDVYVGTLENGLYRSQDGGATFNKVAPTGSATHVTDIEITEDGGMFLAIRASIIWYSDTGDPGSWVIRITGLPTSGHGRIEMATAPSNDDVAYACYTVSFDTLMGVYKTEDKGLNWVEINDPGGDKNFTRAQGWYNMIIQVDPTDEDHIIAGGVPLWRSQDGGDTWMQLSHRDRDSTGYQYVHVDQHEVLFQNGDTALYGNDGGVYRSNNMQDDFPDIYQTNNDYNVTQFYTVAIHPFEDVIIGGTQDNGSPGSTDAGVSAWRMHSWLDGGWCTFHPTDTNILYTSSQRRWVYRFTEGRYAGPTDTITNDNIEDADVQFINPFEMDPHESDRLYMAATALWRLDNASTADSTDWVQASEIAGGRISALSPSPETPGRIFVAISGRIFKLEDADVSTSLTPFIDLDPSGDINSGSVSSIFVDPNNDDHLVVTLTNFGIDKIYETQNANDPAPSWESVHGDWVDIPVRWAMLHPGNSDVCYIGTEMGVFYTDNLNGASTVWVSGNDGLANVPVYMLKYRASDGLCVAATHGRGMFSTTLDLTGANIVPSWVERGPNNIGGRTRALMIDPNDPSGNTLWAGSVAGGLWKTENIPAANEEDIRTPFSVELNAFPNPVAGESVTLTFNLRGTTNGQLNIMDLQGRKVAQLVGGKLMAGNHSYSWNANAYPPGTYLAVLNIGKNRETRKIVVMR